MKRVFGIFEAVFDITYLIAAFLIGFILIRTGTDHPVRTLSGLMALVLAGGDTFHLLPRIRLIITRQEERLRPALGRGKQITSITMAVFYLFLWQIGLSAFSLKNPEYWSYLVYLLAAVRIVLCLLPQNKWQDRYPPVHWGIMRNIPFFLLGITVAGLFFLHGDIVPGIAWMWFAIILSFALYLPVVLWSNKNAKIGMLMLPKTCTYIWMLAMCFSL